jgi:hypothetical protein
MSGAISLLGCILAQTEEQFYRFYPKPTVGEREKHGSDFWERVCGIRNETGKKRSEKARMRNL